MFTMAIGLRGQAQSKGWLPTKAVRLAALLGALVLMSIAVNALTIFADSKSRPAAHPSSGANTPALSASL